MSNWTIFSNHGHVLFCLARDPDSRLRDVAIDVGLTERAVQKIVRDLQDGGMISVSKQGRRNSYRIDTKTALRHHLEAHCTLGALVDLISDQSNETTKQAETGPVEPVQVKAVEPERDKIAKTESTPDEDTSGSPKQADTDTRHPIERQQGTLF